MKKLLSILILFILNCQFYKESKTDDLELLGLFSRLSKVTLTGKAIKGPYKNARVRVFPLNLDGKCNTGLTLGTGFTNSSGDYSISYPKTDGLVCVVVDANSQGTTTLFDEKTGKDLPVNPENNFSLINVVPEYSLTGRRISLGVTPISKMLLNRMENLAQGNSDPKALERAYRSASREMVIRFNLSRGLNTRSISDSGVPSLEELNIDWNDLQNPTTLQMLTLLAGFSQLANDFKKKNDLEIKDIDQLLQVFAEDASDGKFDGKNKDTVLQMPNGEAMGDNPLSNRLGKAIQKFIAEGGKLGSGTNSPVEIPSTLLTEILAFNDATPILSSEPVTILTEPNPVPVTPIVSFGNTETFTHEAQGMIYIPVVLSVPSTNTITITYSVTGGTATQGVDYILNSGSLSFAPGQTVQSIPVTLISDGISEPTETILITLSNPTGADLGTITSHTIHISDVSLPVVQFQTTGINNSENISTYNIPIILNQTSPNPVTVSVAVISGTATPSVDYNFTPTTITIPAGQTTQSVNFSIINDTLAEPNETIVFQLSSPSGATLGVNTTFTYTIMDDDPPIVSYSIPFLTLVAGQYFQMNPSSIQGMLTGCNAPTLPAGLSVAPDCTITGTPSTTIALSTYTINPMNGSFVGNTSLQIQIVTSNPYTNQSKYYLSTSGQSCFERCSSLGGVDNDLLNLSMDNIGTACANALNNFGLSSLGSFLQWSGNYPCMYNGSNNRYITSTLGFSDTFAEQGYNLVCPCKN